MQEGESVVVVFDVERTPQTLGQPLQETEETLVVADPSAVERFVLKLDSEWLIDRFLKLNDGQLTVMNNLKLDEIVSRLKSVINRVPDRLAVDGQDLVARTQTRFVGD